MASLLENLKARGCIHDVSHEAELSKLLDGPGVAFYCGFDPTADSLHAGSMLPLILMRRLQEAGHRPIVILGSATGMIGDPSGKSEERKLLDEETLAANVAGIEKQIRLFLSDAGDNAYVILKNSDWLGNMHFLDFLREVGKHFTVNSMIAKDSVRARLENREQGISYTEFSYMLLQAYDFYWLNKTYDCRLQVGGSDQWGNITGGLDLIRRKRDDEDGAAYGMTFPLLMNSSGTKFGKTEKGAVWLSAERTSPYEFYQFWMNTADADVIRYIKLFTSISGPTLSELEEKTRTKPEERLAQIALAGELTTLIHGEAETAQAVYASKLLFGEALGSVDAKTLLQVFADVPSTELPKARVETGLALLELLVESGLCDSKGAARRALEGGGIYVNNERRNNVQEVLRIESFVEGSLLILRSGKKNYHLIRLV